MPQDNNAELYIRNIEKSTFARLILWTVLVLSGFIVLVLLVAIVTTLFEKSPSFERLDIEQRIGSFDHDPFIVSVPPKEENEAADDVQDIIKQIHNRKGYSNPTRSVDSEEDKSEEVITRRPRRRLLKPIGTDFNPNKSYVIRHANGNLTYIFPTNYTTARPSRRTTIPVPTDPPVQSRDEYPAELIDKLMTIERSNFEGAFGEDIVIPNGGDSLNRRSDTPDEPFLCESEQRVFHPITGQTKDNATVWIVNIKDYKQGVRIETCRFPGQPCRYCDFATVCKQVHHYRTLVAVDKNTNTVYKEQILLKSGCRCARLQP